MKSMRPRACDFFRSIQATWIRRCMPPRYLMRIRRRLNVLNNRRCAAAGCGGVNRLGVAMLAATSAVQRPADAKLLVVDSKRNLMHVPRTAFVEFLRPNDLIIANDAATMPASLTGVHQQTGKA